MKVLGAQGRLATLGTNDQNVSAKEKWGKILHPQNTTENQFSIISHIFPTCCVTTFRMPASYTNYDLTRFIHIGILNGYQPTIYRK